MFESEMENPIGSIEDNALIDVKKIRTFEIILNFGEISVVVKIGLN